MSYDQKIFLDPDYLCGINIGGEQVKEIYLKYLREETAVTVVEEREATRL